MNMSAPVVINLANVTTLRAGRATLDDINFIVHEGESWVIMGPNGAGKSTLLSICATISKPSHGTATILGHRVGTIDVAVLRRHIGFVTSHHQLEWPMTARDIVLTSFTNTVETPMRWRASAEQKATADAQLARFGLDHVADTMWSRLSQGELGRTFLARAALGQPRLLLLDEPAAGLDLAAREQLLEIIASLGEQVGTTGHSLTSVIVTHHLEEVPVSATHAALMQRGRIVHTGRIDDVLTSTNISTVFDTPVRVQRLEDGRWSARRSSSP